MCLKFYRTVGLLERSTLYEFLSRGVEEMDAGLLALTEKEQDLRGRLSFFNAAKFRTDVGAT
jgi:hypothetical protein